MDSDSAAATDHGPLGGELVSQQYILGRPFVIATQLHSRYSAVLLLFEKSRPRTGAARLGLVRSVWTRGASPIPLYPSLGLSNHHTFSPF